MTSAGDPFRVIVLAFLKVAPPRKLDLVVNFLFKGLLLGGQSRLWQTPVGLT